MLTAPCRPRRILQVITPSRMSGAETQLVRLTQRMQARGHVLSTIIKRGSIATAEMHRQGLRAEPRRIGGKLNLGAPGIIASEAKKLRANIVVSTLSTASWWTGWLDRLYDIPTIGHVQGFTSALWHRQQRHLLAASNAVKDDLIAQGIDGRRITVMHNALAPEDFQAGRERLALRAEMGADAATPVVGSFGHLSEKKGYRELFEAIPRVLREVPDAQFWIAGAGKLYDELQAAARRGGFHTSIRLLGFRRDVADLMNAIDVMALPSHREPCALVYVEAALSKKPVVACRAGGAPESVAHGETGLLVPVRDSAAIAGAVLELLTNRDRARRMGEAGYHRARELFGWERFIRILEMTYEKVLDEHANSRLTRRNSAA